MDWARSPSILASWEFSSAINRWGNYVYDQDGERRQDYSRLSQEPRAVKFEIAQIQNGSVIIDTVVRYLDGQILTAVFLTGLFTNAAYDILKGHLIRAQRRVMYGNQAMTHPNRHMHMIIQLDTFDGNGQPFLYQREILVRPDAVVITLPPSGSNGPSGPSGPSGPGVP